MVSIHCSRDQFQADMNVSRVSRCPTQTDHKKGSLSLHLEWMEPSVSLSRKRPLGEGHGVKLQKDPTQFPPQILVTTIFFALVRLSNNPPNIFEQSLSKILGTPLSTTWMVKNRPGVCPCGDTIRLKHHQASPGCGRDPKAATSCGSGSLDFPKVCVTKMAGRYIMTWGRWMCQGRWNSM